MFIKLIQRFYLSSISFSQMVNEIKKNKKTHNLKNILFLAGILLFVGYIWNIAIVIESFLRVSPLAGKAEIIFLIKRFVIFDLIPFLILIPSFHFLAKEKRWLKSLEMATAIWTQSIMVRLLMDGIPLLYPNVNYYPIPYMEIPQAVAYLLALLSLGTAVFKYVSKTKDIKKKKSQVKKLSIGWIILVFMGAVALYWYPLVKSMPLFIKAPQFVMPAANGKTCDLSKEKGKVVLIEFWSYRCPHCIKQAKELEILAEKIDPSDVTILSIHTRGGERMANVVNQFVSHKNITLCLDDGTVSDVYSNLPPYHRLKGIPHMMIVDRHGMIRKVIRGRKSYTVIKAEIDKITAR
jgi:peroxiredoxin